MSTQKLGCENDLDTILDRISDGFFTLDTEWCFTQLNRKTAEALAPHKPEVLIGKCIWKMFPGTIGSVVWNAARARFRPRRRGIAVKFNALIRAVVSTVHFQDFVPAREGARRLDGMHVGFGA